MATELQLIDIAAQACSNFPHLVEPAAGKRRCLSNLTPWWDDGAFFLLAVCEVCTIDLHVTVCVLPPLPPTARQRALLG